MNVKINDNYSKEVDYGSIKSTSKDSFGRIYSMPSPEFNALNVSISTPNCEEKGIEYLTKATEQGHPNALKDLAELNIKEF